MYYPLPIPYFFHESILETFLTYIRTCKDLFEAIKLVTAIHYLLQLKFSTAKMSIHVKTSYSEFSYVISLSFLYHQVDVKGNRCVVLYFAIYTSLFLDSVEYPSSVLSELPLLIKLSR